MKNVFPAMIALAIVAMMTVAAAHTPNPNGNCNNVGDDTYSVEGVKLAVSVPDVATVYVGSDATLWSETNGIAGLQTHEHTCRLNHVGTTVSPDTPLL